MSHYIDGFVLPVPSENIEAYREMAAEAGKMWIEHGALGYVECVGDDLDPEMEGMAFTTFPELVDTGPEETVVFAFITYDSRAHRDEVNAAVMEEMEEKGQEMDQEMPFDVARMSYGGFDTIVDLVQDQAEKSMESSE